MYTVYFNKDNTFAVQLTRDGLAIAVSEMEAITKVELLLNGVLRSSAVFTSAFDWVTRKAESVIIFDLGGISGLSPGHDKTAELILYGANYPAGIVWTTLDIRVIDL